MIKRMILVLVLCIATVSFTQKMQVLNGDLKSLKNISKYELLFDYSDVQIPNFESEESFLKEKATLREQKKKEKEAKATKLSKRLSVAYFNLAKTISIYIKRKS